MCQTSAGLGIGAAYTYASAYSYTDQADIQLPGAIQDAFNVRADKAPPNDYLRHNFSLDFLYELPLAKMSGIFTAQSGNPVNITQSTAFSSSRGDYIGANPELANYGQTLKYLNRAAFATVPIGVQSGASIRP